MPYTPSGSVQTALRRAQIPLILGAAAVLLSIPIGVLLLAIGDSAAIDITAGILLLVFCAAGILGVVVSGLYLRRGVRVARSQTEFLAAVSHELRTPMTSMQIFVDALLDERLTDEAQRKECLQTLRTELLRLDRLLARLLAVARLEASPDSLARDPVAVADLVSDAVTSHNALQLADGNRQGKVAVDLEPDLWLAGDRDALLQALSNLLSNARNHGGPGLDIQIRGRTAGEQVDLAVIDQGPGLAPAEVRRVFGMFQRGDTARQEGTPGSGLGLAIVQGIAKAHGGRVELRPGEGSGCAFHLLLPRVPRPVAPGGGPPEADG